MQATKEIPITDIKSDTYYDAPLWLDESFLLLSCDAPVTEDLLTALKKWGYKTVLTDGSRVAGNTATSSAAKSVSGAILNNDAKETEGRNIAADFFRNLTAFTAKTYETFNRDGNLDMASITERVKDTIQIIKEYRTYILRLPDLHAAGLDYLYNHSARSTIIALAIGDTLKLPNFRLIELGIAALLHEVGMMQIPKKVFDKAATLTDKERQIINTHCARGYRMLQEYSKENPNPLAQDILLGVYQHHERANGSGYPDGLSGEGISLFGKIIGVACSYDAQISNRPHRDKVDGFTSMINLLREMKHLYDEKIVSALLLSISIYPLGSYVKLKNGAIGTVVDTGMQNPKFPVVKLLLDENMHLYKEQPIIQTRDENGWAVAGVINEKDVVKLKEKDLLPR